MEEEDENCEIQKPQLRHIKDEKQMKDLVVNIMLIFDLLMIKKSVNDNNNNEGFGMQRFENNLSRVLIESTKVFAQSSRVFIQTSNLLEQPIEKLVQLADVMP